MQIVTSSFLAGAVDDLARSRFDMSASRWSVIEVARRLDDDVHAEISPWQRTWIPLGEHLDDVAVHGDAVSTRSYQPWEAAEDAVVLEQMRQ
jgi:hypothetical protein